MSNIAHLKSAAPPRRPRLAELHAHSRALAAEIASLTPSQAERVAAMTALPAALETMKAALLERELGEADTVEATKAEVLRLRGVIADTPDLAARIAGLHAECARIGDAIAAEQRAAVLGELAALTATYQAGAKQALVAEAAIQGLREYAFGIEDHALATVCNLATKMHPDLTEEAARQAKTKEALSNVRRVWALFPRTLAGDPEAQPEPLETAIAMLPKRREEESEPADAA